MRNQKGITLIALVITIIVMLILVGVSVTVALNGGLFSTAQKATGDTKAERDNELALSDGKVTINGEEYNSIDEYVKGEGSNEPTEPENPTTPSEPVKVTITPKKETYTIGEEVTIGEENFYVIADDTNKVTLLAKDNINTTNLVQSDANAVEFSSTNYWYNEKTDSIEEDLNSLEVPEGVTTPALTAAKLYGEKIGGTGRLMTLEEAEALEINHEGIIYIIINLPDDFLDYWLGTAGGYDEVYQVSDYIGSAPGGLGSIHFVRPVVEISKANIS